MSGVLQEQEISPSVLITGASGFLGKYAVSEFAGNGYEVVATGRNTHALASIEQPGVTTLAVTLEDMRELEMPVDTLIHAAALSSPWGRWRDFYESNVDGTEHIIRFAVRNKVQRFIYVSSPSIYSGPGDRLNIAEDEYDAGNHLNHYIRSKLQAEQRLKEAHETGDLPELLVIRPRGLIGIGDPSLVPRLLEANRKTGIPLFFDGQNEVDLTCVENVALALRLATEARNITDGTFNITNGEPARFKDLVDSFFLALGETPHYKQINYKVAYYLAAVLEKACMLLPNTPEPPLTRYTVTTLAHSQTLDISRARAELGYQPKLSLVEGIAKFAAHHRSSHV